MKLIAIAAALTLGAAAPSSTIVLREQAWMASAEARAFLEEPAECLASRDRAVETGRALFRSPALLGGPAARAGLSCNACHSGGRRNARFLLPELTDRAGAADVTSEWSSKVRGDGLANPVDIPDLNGVTRRAAFGQRREPSLGAFIHGVMVEEFQGEEPSATTVESVLAYLRALDEGECSARGTQRITLASTADDVRRAVAATEGADEETASLLLLSAQDAMGRIVERLPARRFSRERQTLEALSRDLGVMRNGDVGAATAAVLPGWRARFDAATARITRRERQTYFNERTLARALRDQRS